MTAADVLTLDQVRTAYRIGLERHAAASRRSGTHLFGYTPEAHEGRNNDGMSAVAECLVAVAIGRAWTSSGLVPDRPDAGDVDGGISVRWTPLEDGCLIVRPGEPPDLIAVLVCGPTYSSMRIAGWITLREAFGVGNLKSPNGRPPAYFVPQAALLPIARLRAWEY